MDRLQHNGAGDHTVCADRQVIASLPFRSAGSVFLVSLLSVIHRSHDFHSPPHTHTHMRLMLLLGNPFSGGAETISGYVVYVRRARSSLQPAHPRLSAFTHHLAS